MMPGKGQAPAASVQANTHPTPPEAAPRDPPPSEISGGAIAGNDLTSKANETNVARARTPVQIPPAALPLSASAFKRGVDGAQTGTRGENVAPPPADVHAKKATTDNPDAPIARPLSPTAFKRGVDATKAIAIGENVAPGAADTSAKKAVPVPNPAAPVVRPLSAAQASGTPARTRSAIIAKIMTALPSPPSAADIAEFKKNLNIVIRDGGGNRVMQQRPTPSTKRVPAEIAVSHASAVAKDLAAANPEALTKFRSISKPPVVKAPDPVPELLSEPVPADAEKPGEDIDVPPPTKDQIKCVFPPLLG
jgi:hypothetical protein